MGYIRTGNPTGRPGRTPPEVWEKAKAFLEDGASYREVAYTLDIPRSTLRGRLPGYGWSSREGGDMLSTIKKYQSTFDELWDPKKRGK